MDIDYRIGHMLLGGLTTLAVAPAFAHVSRHNYPFILFASVLAGTLLEIAQWRQWYPHEATTWGQSLSDISEWALGGFIFAVFIGLAKYL